MSYADDLAAAELYAGLTYANGVKEAREAAVLSVSKIFDEVLLGINRPAYLDDLKARVLAAIWSDDAPQQTS